MLPQLDPQTGYPPIGRHTATFDEVKRAFVLHPTFSSSTTRGALWDNLLAYLRTWEEVWSDLSAERPQVNVDQWLRGLWLGGSFISDRLDPRNIDLTLFIDGAAVAGCKGASGSKKIVKLGHREGMLKRFQLSPIVVRYEPVVSPFQPSRLTPRQQEYLMLRGGFDDWWQRARPSDQPRGAPTESTEPSRGYVEVLP